MSHDAPPGESARGAPPQARAPPRGERERERERKRVDGPGQFESRSQRLHHDPARVCPSALYIYIYTRGYLTSYRLLSLSLGPPSRNSFV